MIADLSPQALKTVFISGYLGSVAVLVIVVIWLAYVEVRRSENYYSDLGLDDPDIVLDLDAGRSRVPGCLLLKMLTLSGLALAEGIVIVCLIFYVPLWVLMGWIKHGKGA